MWINQLQIFFPIDEQKGFIQGSLLPYDGTHLLATGGRSVRVFNLAAKRKTDASLDSMLAGLVAELARQSKTATAVRFLSVSSLDPSKPVLVTVFFADDTHYTIADCYALAATDSVFAGVFTGTLTKVATLSGLTVA
jgi:hypothetical protein